MPKENAPGPDGFIGAFYSTCWDVIKSDVCQAVWQLFHLRGHTFNLLNTANIVLLPKKDLTESVGDFRPISLVHSIAKKKSLQDPCVKASSTPPRCGVLQTKCIRLKEIHS
jgi:hypothetical protein